VLSVEHSLDREHIETEMIRGKERGHFCQLSYTFVMLKLVYTIVAPVTEHDNSVSAR